MNQRTRPDPTGRVKRSAPGFIRKAFELAVAHELDSQPAGTRSMIATRIGRSRSWLSRALDPYDTPRFAASDQAIVCQLLQTVRPMAAVLADTKVAGCLWTLTPADASGTGDMRGQLLRLGSEVGLLQGRYEDASADGRIDDGEREELDERLTDVIDRAKRMRGDVRDAS